MKNRVNNLRIKEGTKSVQWLSQSDKTNKDNKFNLLREFKQWFRGRL